MRNLRRPYIPPPHPHAGCAVKRVTSLVLEINPICHTVGVGFKGGLSQSGTLIFYFFYGAYQFFHRGDTKITITF